MEEQIVKKQKWIIDTDPGCDDMICIFYMINRPDVEIEFISLSEGNCKMEDLVVNVKKTLKIIGKNVPVFQGSKYQLIHGQKNAYDYHYSDGLGAIPEIMSIDVNDEINGPEKSAALQYVKSVNKYPGEITLLALAPTTNLVLAEKIDPSIKHKFKNILLMGGSYGFNGNVCASAEFNFHHDYLSCCSFLSKFKNLLIFGWEPCLPLIFKSEHLEIVKQKAIEIFGGYNEYVYKIVELVVAKYSKEMNGVQICDLYTAISYFRPETVSKYFISSQKILIDTEKLNGTLVCYDIEYNSLTFENWIKDYYLKGKEIVPNKNVYVEEMQMEAVISEFVYIIKPNK